MTRHRHKERSRGRCWSGVRGGKPNWRTSFPRAISCSVMRNRSHCLSQRKNKINASPLPIYGVPCIQASCVTADIPRPNMAPDSPLLGALLGSTPSDVTLMETVSAVDRIKGCPHPASIEGVRSICRKNHHVRVHLHSNNEFDSHQRKKVKRFFFFKDAYINSSLSASAEGHRSSLSPTFQRK